MLNSKNLRSLLTIFLVAFTLRIGYCAVSGKLGHPREKYREYIIAADRLIQHGTLVSPFIEDDSVRAPSALLPPIYVGVVAAAFQLFGSETIAAFAALQGLNALAGACTAVYTYLAASRIAGPTAAWIAAIFCILNPLLIHFTEFIWDTSLFAAAASGCVWAAASMSHRVVGWKAMFALGCLLGLTALLNPSLTLGYPVLVLWSLSGRLNQGAFGGRGAHSKTPSPLPLRVRGLLRRALAPVAVVICGWILVLLPWTVRNYVQLGEVLYVRSGLMLEVWLGVSPEMDVSGAIVYQSRFPLQNAEEQELISRIGEAAYLQRCRELAINAIGTDPLRFVRLSFLRTLDYWLATNFTHSSVGSGGWPSKASRWVLLVLYTSELIVIAGGFVFARQYRSEIVLLSLILLVFSLVYILTKAEVRFRAPGEGVMAALVAICLSEIWQSWRSNSGTPTTPA